MPAQNPEKQEISPTKSTNSDRSGHRLPSIASSASSLGSQSVNSQTSRASALQDKTFAPPPKVPLGLQESQLSPENKALLPQFEAVKHSGHCLGRLSLKSMITKKWKATFWIAYGDTQIMFFRSKNDFEECFSNPYLGEAEKRQLVKLKIDFSHDPDQPDLKGYSVSRMSTKSYARDGYMSHFKLEKWDNSGPTICAALGGKNATEVNSLRTIMKEMIQYSQQRSRRTPVDNSNDADAHYSSDYGSRNGSVRSSSSAYDREQPSSTAYSYEHDNAEASASHVHNNGDGRPQQPQRSNPGPRGDTMTRLKGMMQPKNKEPSPYDGRPKSREKARSKSREPGERSGILQKISSMTKKKHREEDVQYYVGRPSTQKEYAHRPAEIDYGN